jgi:hypothetical protein
VIVFAAFSSAAQPVAGAELHPWIAPANFSLHQFYKLNDFGTVSIGKSGRNQRSISKAFCRSSLTV